MLFEETSTTLLETFYTKVWNKQFTFAVVDLPIMILLWFCLTGFEMYGSNIAIRTWNPFAAHELRNINGGSWGFCRLGILNDADALWFNLSQAFVLALLWVVEIIQDPQANFDVLKLLALMTLVIRLVGYELVSRDIEKSEKETLASLSMGEGSQIEF